MAQIGTSLLTLKCEWLECIAVRQFTGLLVINSAPLQRNVHTKKLYCVAFALCSGISDTLLLMYVENMREIIKY